MLGQAARPFKYGAEIAAMPARWGVRPAFLEYSYIPGSGAYGSAPIHAAMVAALTTHANDGGIVGLNFHFPNFITTFDCYDRLRDDTACVDNLLASAGVSTEKTAWYSYLDGIADTLNALVDSQGRKIPVAVRLFHESNGWHNYLLNDDANGANQVETRTITSLTGSGTVLTAVMEARPAPAAYNFSLAAGTYVQITGASAGYNGSYQVSVCTPTGDPEGQVSTLSLVRSNGSAVTAGAAAAPGTLYATAGFWWAGRDRSANVMKLFNEAVRYIRVIRRVTNALFYTAPYPYDQYAVHWSSNEAQVDSIGRSFAYTNWHPGDENTDLQGIDYYHFATAYTADVSADSVLQASAARIKALSPGKPLFMGEIAALSNGRGDTQAGFWTGYVNGILAIGVAANLLWDETFFPESTDPAGPSFQVMLDDPRCITLAKLSRGW